MMDRLEAARSTGSPLPTGPGRLFVQWAARINLFFRLTLIVLWIVAFAVWMTDPPLARRRKVRVPLLPHRVQPLPHIRAEEIEHLQCQRVVERGMLRHAQPLV